jgi:hypothetical protein
MLERDFEHRRTDVNIGDQRADAIYTAVRDQYINNELALRIAPMRRRARRLLRVGWTLILLGVAIDIAAVTLFMIELSRLADSLTWDSSDMPFEYLVLAAGGTAVGTVGVACAITSVFIRRSARRQAERL